MSKDKLVSLPELRQAQQVTKDFGVLLNLLDEFQGKLYTYSHYQLVNELNNYLNECKEELELKRDVYSRKLGTIHEKE